MIYEFLQIIYAFSEGLYKGMVEAGEQGYRISAGGVFTFLTGYLSYLLIMFLMYYLFRSFGLYNMAKKRGIEKPARCFIPFYAIFMISELRSDCNAFKKHKFYPIVAVSAIGVMILTSAIVDICFSVNVIKQLIEFENANPGNSYLTAGMFSNSNLPSALMNISDLAKIVYIVFMAMIYCDLFRTYAPFKSKTHTVLSVIFVVFTGSMLLFGIFVFTLSGQTAVNFDEILEKRRVYYGYGNPYYGNRNGNGGYNNNGYNNNGSGYNGQNDNPFSDFSNGNNNGYGKSSDDGNDPFTEFRNTDNGSQNDPFADFSSGSGSVDNNGNNGENGSGNQSGNNGHDDSDSLF